MVFFFFTAYQLPVLPVLAIFLVASLLPHFMVGDSKTNEETYKKCIKDANRKFATLARSIYTSDIFDGAINNLKCIYVSNQFLWIFKLSLAKLLRKLISSYPVGIYMFKVNNRNPRTRCEIWSKLAINTPEPRQFKKYFARKMAFFEPPSPHATLCNFFLKPSFAIH